MRVTLIIATLGPGGAERVMTTMANYWNRKGWPVTLVTLMDAGTPPFYPLDARVTLDQLGLLGVSTGVAGAIASNAVRMIAIRKAVRASRPRVVISFGDRTNITTLLATAGTGHPVIVAERTDPAQHVIGRAWSNLRRLTYPRAARVVVQSPRALSFFPPRVCARGRVIPNPVIAPAALPSRPLRNRQNPVLMAMGQLSEHKGFDTLIRAFARVAAVNPIWTLEIWGEGPDRAALEALRSKLGLEARVRLPGLTRTPTDVMQRADLFVLSSRFEGFPNALAEAMACGLPVISFDCPSGPSELIRPGVDGILVPPRDEAALAGAIGRLLSDAAERGRLAARAPEVITRFSLERIMEQWEESIQEVLA